MAIVYTKQNAAVAEILEKDGIYRPQARFVRRGADDHKGLVLQCYDWLARHLPGKPEGSDYPVWVCMERDATMLPTPGSVTLVLDVPDELIIPINIEKWTAILNYSYIAADKNDRKNHIEMLKNMGINDVDAFLTPFYPQLKREIMESWSRLFDDEVTISGNTAYYGNIWEIRGEWVREIIR